jgi:hypothetical protein
MPNEIPNRIYTHFHSRVAHPGTNELVRFAHCMGAKRAGQTARFFADFRQSANAL